MHPYFEIVAFISEYIIKGIFISVLIIALARKLFKGKVDANNAFQIIAWLMPGYAVLILGYYLIILVFPNALGDLSGSLWARATGPYWYAWWLIFVFNCVLPLLLLIKKLRGKAAVLFIIGILMNFGWLFESFVIHVTAMHRDYIPSSVPFDRELMALFKGVIVGVIAMIVGNLWTRYKVGVE